MRNPKDRGLVLKMVLRQFNNSVKKRISASRSDWSECYDESSGYAYFWNLRTNEVRWDKPEDFVSPAVIPAKDKSLPANPPLPPASSSSHESSNGKTEKLKVKTKLSELGNDKNGRK